MSTSFLLESIEYRPKRYKIPEDGDDIDVDPTNAGDFITCPVHDNTIIYVFGTNFWSLEGGTSSYGWETIIVKCWCGRCQKHYYVNLGSYGG